MTYSFMTSGEMLISFRTVVPTVVV